MEGSDAQRQPKHLVIHSATNRLFAQVELLESAVNDISPSPKTEKTVAEAKLANPNLAEFLNTEGDRIGSATERIVRAIEEIKTLLF